MNAISFTKVGICLTKKQRYNGNILWFLLLTTTMGGSILSTNDCTKSCAWFRCFDGAHANLFEGICFFGNYGRDTAASK